MLQFYHIIHCNINFITYIEHNNVNNEYNNVKNEYSNVNNECNDANNE